MSETVENNRLTVGLAQIAPVWLDRQATLQKICDYVASAADRGCDLVCFGEALLPGYPFWIEHTHGARFEAPDQKRFYAHYVSQAVQIEAGHLQTLEKLVRQKNIAVYLGIIEQPGNRGQSLYASLVYLDGGQQPASVHRKLMPTHEERLSWSPGDGHGLVTHPLRGFTVGGLNCWENWMPLARAALYGQGENVHVAVWPGNLRNTEQISRFIAQESRSYVISVSGLMSTDNIPDSHPYKAEMEAALPPVCANGGSCIVAPDGSWLLEPVCDREELLVAELSRQDILEARHSFDPSGHYARPDVTRLLVNKRRQQTVEDLD